MNIVIEGNDGTGKSTLVNLLKFIGYKNVLDRGILTKMTDDDSILPDPEDLYIILDVPVEISYARLEACNKPMNEYYHTVIGLTHYRTRYQEIAKKLGYLIINTNQPKLDILKLAIVEIQHRIESKI